MTTTIDELRDQFHDLEAMEQDVLDHPEREPEYIAAWTEMLFALLSFVARQDEEELERLKVARQYFVEAMVRHEQRPGTRVIYWQRILAGWLAFALPEDQLDDIPASVWEGPWIQEVPDA